MNSFHHGRGRRRARKQERFEESLLREDRLRVRKRIATLLRLGLAFRDLQQERRLLAQVAHTDVATAALTRGVVRACDTDQAVRRRVGRDSRYFSTLCWRNAMRRVPTCPQSDRSDSRSVLETRIWVVSTTLRIQY